MMGVLFGVVLVVSLRLLRLLSLGLLSFRLLGLRKIYIFVLAFYSDRPGSRDRSRFVLRGPLAGPDYIYMIPLGQGVI